MLNIHGYYRVIIGLMMVNNNLVGGWPTPLKNDGVSNSWDDDIPNIWKVIKFMFQTTNQHVSVPESMASLNSAVSSRKRSMSWLNSHHFLALDMSTSFFSLSPLNDLSKILPGIIYIYMYTWWFIPLSKWVITPVINGISRVNPLITGVITHLLSGMNHQVYIYICIIYWLSTLDY